MGERHFDLTSADGTPLKATVWDADSPAAMILWIHGFAEHRLRYADFARFLNGRGFSFAALDLRGHGDSGGKRGFVRRWDDYLEDVSALLEWSSASIPADLPLVMGSHSMGGLVASRFLEKGEFARPIDAAVFSGPFMGLAMAVPAWKRQLGKAMSSLIPGLSVPAGLPPELISHDPDIVQSYATDPRVFRNATARWFTEMVHAQELAISEASRIRMPVLVCQGMGDRVVNVQTSRRFFDGIAAADRTWKGFDGLYHEILNEAPPARGEVYNTFADWLGRRFSR